VFLLLVTLSLDAEGQAPESVPSLRPEHLPGASAWPHWQILQADGKGRLFLLRNDTWEVYPLSADGELGEPRQLEAGPGHPEIQGDSRAVGAVMSRDGDWATHEVYQVRLFDGTEEQLLAAPKWSISGIALLGDDPVLSGTPHSLALGALGKQEIPESAPLFLRWDGDRWEPLADSRTVFDEKQGPAEFDEQRSARLFGSSDDRLWVAFDYRHRFHEYSPAGRLLTEIVVADGEARPAADAESRQEQLAEEARQWTKEFGGRVKAVVVTEVTATPVAKAIAEGPDGRLYFLIAGGAGTPGAEMTLERYDPVNLRLERLPLRMPSQGRCNMAAGQSGLYIAADVAKKGLWRMSWEQLDAAEWMPVEDARVFAAVGRDELEGTWKEKAGKGLVRFAGDRVITHEEDRLTVRGLVSLAGQEALLRRLGYGENWKIAKQGDVLRIEREGKAREYVRIAETPAAVSLAPLPLGEAKELPAERVRTIQAELAQRVNRSESAKTPEEKLRVEAENLQALRALVAEVGWLDVRRFGVKAARDAAALAQQGPDVLLLLAAAPLVEQDFKDSPQGGPAYSAFADALQVALGAKQRYGTQIGSTAAGEPVVLPLESRNNVDDARKKLGLPSLAKDLDRTSRERFQGKPILIADGEVVEVHGTGARKPRPDAGSSREGL
jgi:hypothetical protein